ncbi:hypothetical protein [Gilvimarinus xylanilyticus]|uniref:Sulfotransferase family protein n=1 Tax=Gilvimarinus xylanilyticus TaxID=2944139 RepID=A0A9X2HSS4_9GAMM|nr:hypothetical protein [Gilvimarinus xylanilyticus]MCP8897873.1 hypothetical protein [Gilvimarinus xylanilyticus]
MRQVIFHYHLFKNAGTSLDSQLKKNVKRGEWLTDEFPGPLKPNRAGVKRWLESEPRARVFSSHSAYLPEPDIADVKVLPVIFIRHPIDRIASIHAFEKKQGTDNFGSVLARHTNLQGYIESRLALPKDRLCRNFHSQRFGFRYDPEVGTELFRAQKAVAELPFVGVVDRFEESLVRLQEWLREEGFPGMRLVAVRKNVSRDLDRSLAERLDEIKREIGSDTYKKLLKANEEDLQLYEQASAKL